jgi:hypothetical protein
MEMTAGTEFGDGVELTNDDCHPWSPRVRHLLMGPCPPSSSGVAYSLEMTAGADGGDGVELVKGAKKQEGRHQMGLEQVNAFRLGASTCRNELTLLSC